MCVEEPGPERRSRGEAGLGRPEKHLAAYASPLRSAFLAQRLTPGRGGYPGRRGAHWDFARPLPSSAGVEKRECQSQAELSATGLGSHSQD